MSEANATLVFDPITRAISTTGQYLENHFFQVPVGSTFAFLYDTNTTLSQGTLKQMYQAILASRGVDSGGTLKTEYENAVNVLDNMNGDFAKFNAELNSIGEYESTNLSALLANTITTLDTIEGEINGCSAELFSAPWKKTTILKDIINTGIELNTHYPNLSVDDFKGIFRRIANIRAIIYEVTQPEANRAKSMDLVFPLLGMQGNDGSGASRQNLFTIEEIREWIDGIGSEPGILSSFISDLQKAVLVPGTISKAMLELLKMRFNQK
jgi:hypothetical protein